MNALMNVLLRVYRSHGVSPNSNFLPTIGLMAVSCFLGAFIGLKVQRDKTSIKWPFVGGFICSFITCLVYSYLIDGELGFKKIIGALILGVAFGIGGLYFAALVLLEGEKTEEEKKD